MDWEEILLGKEEFGFLIEVALRTAIMYLCLLFSLKALGKRGVKQLSIFELVIIIGFGSAAGDPMFYKDVGILNAVVVFLVVVLLYKLTTLIVTKSETADKLIEGEPIYLVEDGVFSIANFDKEPLGYDEFFSEMRQQGISHLGQVEQAIIEVSGNISVYFYDDDAVKYGLPILPKLYAKRDSRIPVAGIYSCGFCGFTESIAETDKHICPTCNKDRWVQSLNTKRIR
jgi:uncharacterized membrane protein YcaP (DUF421 family)